MINLTVRLKDYINKHAELIAAGWVRFFACPNYAIYRKGEQELCVDWNGRKKSA